MPKGSTQTRLNNIRKEGATATIEECNYDECVRMAADMAARTEHGIIVQDTAWDGYEEIPAWIMQGYGTMAMEADDQLHEDGCEARLMYLSRLVRIPCRCCSGIFCEPLSQDPAESGRCGSRSGCLPLQRSCCRRRCDPHCRR